MKLYTEEQVKQAMIAMHEVKFMDYTEEEIIDTLIPIEIPSDEEINKYLKSFPYTKHLDDGQYNDGVIYGAELGIEWLKNKIKGGNK